MIQFQIDLNKKQQHWRINDQIFAKELRVITSEGKQLGVLSRSDALSEAKKAGVDLIEIAPKATPPVAKIIEFGKFKYQEEKKLKVQKKKTKTAEIKEIRFSPFIGSGDFKTRIGRVKEFLGDRNKVKLVVKFKGRQMNSKKFGYQILQQIVTEIGEMINVDMEPKFVGRHLTMVISPLSAQKVKEKQNKKSEEKDKEPSEKNREETKKEKHESKTKDKKISKKTL